MIDDHPSPAAPRIALAHDWLCGFRGGEAVLERIAMLAAEIGEIDRLYTMFDDGRPLAPVVDALVHEVSPLGRLPPGARRWLLPAYPAAVRWLSRRLATRHRAGAIDLLISTSSAAIKGLRPPAGVPHLCYCHAPARYIWSVRDEYVRGGGGASAAVRDAGLGAVGPWFKRWDRATAKYVTTFLANSTHTAAEIARCFGREAEVVFPPVRTRFFTPDPARARESFWLFVGALEPYKRADLAIDAARAAGVHLKVVGAGSAASALRARAAGADVDFRGRVDEETLRDLYRRARLLLFPQIEDFGITAAEAIACGCPVVARRAGGALDIVDEGRNGAMFAEPTARDLADAASLCPPEAAAGDADRFSEKSFDDAMRRAIRRELA